MVKPETKVTSSIGHMPAKFHVLIDTCVWLDLAKDYHKRPLLDGIEELLTHQRIELILPRTVLTEFARNKDKVIQENSRSLSSTIKRVKEAVAKFGEESNRPQVLRHLSDLDMLLPTLGDSTETTMERIENIFARAEVIETSDEIKLRAANRAIDGLAPFHIKGKNGIGDAILVETYIEALKSETSAGQRFVFVTLNHHDFSLPGGDQRAPHPDLAGVFTKRKSLYFASLKEALTKIDPDMLEDLRMVQEFLDEPRRQSEIVDSIDEFVTKVWYNRHQILVERIEEGSARIVEEGYVPKAGENPQTYIHQNIWDGATRSAARVEKRFPDEPLSWDDFEWGMLNGKLSALRWVLGEEWDFLDT